MLKIKPMLKIVYESGETCLIDATMLHPYVLGEIRLNGSADYMFADGTLCTIYMADTANESHNK